MHGGTMLFPYQFCFFPESLLRSWKILWLCGISGKIIQMMLAIFSNFNCNVLREGIAAKFGSNRDVCYYNWC
jgi:hypothetical protein